MRLLDEVQEHVDVLVFSGTFYAQTQPQIAALLAAVAWPGGVGGRAALVLGAIPRASHSGRIGPSGVAAVRFLLLGWSIRKLVRTARRYRTIEIQADPRTITAANPFPTTSAARSKPSPAPADLRA